ncbi:uncharacterized protein LOC141894168 [Acropora palmata]|uniref:uncharacterized protein LOC141894168 n=1 Tax=Acropora palmata TaxID=6131 RepID=UPI003DA00C3D
MNDNEGTAAQGPREDEQRLEGEIQKEINKLKYFLEETDDLIQIKDYTEMEIVTKRADKIVDRLSDLISHAEELKIDSGASSRSVRQWKKDIKSSYATLIADKERLSKTLKNRQEQIKEEFERRQLESKREQQQEEERQAAEFRARKEDHERQMWQEKIRGRVGDDTQKVGT